MVSYEIVSVDVSYEVLFIVFYNRSPFDLFKAIIPADVMSTWTYNVKAFLPRKPRTVGGDQRFMLHENGGPSISFYIGCIVIRSLFLRASEL